MTAIHQHDDHPPFLAENDMREWFVTPGKATTIPVHLANQETMNKTFYVSVTGIPVSWLEGIPEKVVVSPGEQKQLVLVIQPPDEPATQTGRYPLRVTSNQTGNGNEKVLVEGTLTVAAYEVQGRLAILMDIVHYSVAPGASVTVEVKVINQGLEKDTLLLTLEGLPAPWVSTTTPSLSLHPGEQKTVSFFIRPAHHPHSRAGRNPFKVCATRQVNSQETASRDCVLTIEAFADFRSTLKPGQVSKGETIQVVIENIGNIPDSYRLDWASTNHQVAFEWLGNALPENHVLLNEAGVVKVRIPPGEMVTLNFLPKLRTGANLLGDLMTPYKVTLTATNGTIQTHTGKVLRKGMIPVWVIQAGILGVLATMCMASFFFFRGNLVAGGATETALAALTGLTQTVESAAAQIAGATQTASANMTQAVAMGQHDDDGDGLTNVQEAEWGTDPLQADSDNDGLLDGAEMNGSTNPLSPDTDGDTLTDGNEVQRGTDPLKADTDGDALSDGQEIQLGTDPLLPDSDSDGLLDGNETAPCPSPLNPDSDNDGFIDGQDFEPCDPNNPSLTATGIVANATPTPLPPPLETPTQIPTDVPTDSPTGVPEPTATPVPQIPSLEGFLAFVSTRDGNPEIYSLNLADNSLVRLTTDPAVDAQPSWSPDGRQLAFATNREGNFEVYVMNADGSGLINLTNQSSDDFDPAWSQDGTQIAFVSNRDGNNEIYHINVDGTNPVNATNNPADDSQPTWFVMDGLVPIVRIAFTSNRDGNREIYAMNPGGTDQKNLSNNPAEDHSPATFSSLGLLTFTSNRDGNQEIYVMSSDGASQINITNSSAEEWSSAWLSIAEWVVFVSNRDGNQELYFGNGVEQFNLTGHPADDYDPSWVKP